MVCKVCLHKAVKNKWFWAIRSGILEKIYSSIYSSIWFIQKFIQVFGSHYAQAYWVYLGRIVTGIFSNTLYIKRNSQQEQMIIDNKINKDLKN